MNLHFYPFSMQSSTARRMAKLAVYWSCFTFSLAFSYLLRLDFVVTSEIWSTFPKNLLVVLLIKTGCLLIFGQFRGLWRFFGVRDALNLGKALFASLFLLISYRLFVEGASLPRSVIVMDYVFSFVFVALVRVAMRPDVGGLTWGSFQQEGEPTLILGAGDAGAALLRSLHTMGGNAPRVVGFLDDDPTKQGGAIHDVPVLGVINEVARIARENAATEALIAMPGASGKRRGEIVHLLTEASLRFRTVPSLEQTDHQLAQIGRLRPVEIEDLLGRPPVPLSSNQIQDTLHGRVVMVTGAGGSIGSELCRQIAGYYPSHLLVIDRSETQMFPLEQELLHYPGLKFTPAIADVRDQQVMRKCFLEHRPQIVFHSAAHKHVPLMELQPAEAFRNNTLATRDLSELASECGTEKFVLISTDKAINPTSVMGATKRLAELVLQSRNSQKTSATRFVSVRFGNVLGSSGSVLCIFREQLAKGKTLTVTHPEMRRYFMTIPEAAGLVLQSASQARGGEIYVLDMGEPVRIHDLATNLIQLSGLRPGADVEIKITGIRPGEKLFEELTHSSEIVLQTEHPRILQYKVTNVPPVDFLASLASIEDRLDLLGPGQVKLAIQSLVPEYTPYGVNS